MLQKLIAVLKSDAATSSSGITTGPRYEPYMSASTNALYNLLFGDDLAAFDWGSGQDPFTLAKGSFVHAD